MLRDIVLVVIGAGVGGFAGAAYYRIRFAADMIPIKLAVADIKRVFDQICQRQDRAHARADEILRKVGT